MEPRKTSSIMQAVIHNNKPTFEFLLSLSPKSSLDRRNAEGKTALFLAVFYGRNEMAAVLLKAGANPNIPNDFGWTPLMQARFQRNFMMMDILRKACADLTMKNFRGETIYDMNFGDGPLMTPILLNDLITLNERLQKIPILHYAYPIKISIALKRYACLAALLKQARNLNEENYLEKAFLLDDLVSFELLLKAGANPNIKDDFGNTLLHIAVMRKKYLFANALLRYNANVNVVDKFGETPLMIATHQKDAFSMKVLADKKPDLTIKNTDGDKKPSIKHFSFFHTPSVITLMTGAFCAGMLVHHFIRSRRH